MSDVGTVFVMAVLAIPECGGQEQTSSGHVLVSTPLVTSTAPSTPQPVA